MKCKKCGAALKKFAVEVEDSDLGSQGLECTKCGELYFNEKKGKAIVENLKTKEICQQLPALSIQQKVIKLSKNRLGLYINKDIARCAKIKPGEPIEVRLLDKKKILLEIK